MQPTEPAENSAPNPDSLSRLMKLAGTPEAPSAEATARAREAALRSWLQGTQQQQQRARRPRMWWSLAAAALVLVLVGVTMWQQAPYRHVIAQPAAQIVSAQGVGYVASEQGVQLIARPSVPIFAGARLRTDDGMLALQVGEVLSLRLNQHTELIVKEADDITLLRGSVYVDTGGVNAATKLRVRTPAGQVRHLGTQFQVAVNDGDTRITVREGRVLLESQSTREEVTAGERLLVDASGARSREAVSTFGADWQWVADIGKPMDIENRPLIEFLAWMVREQGWQLRFMSPGDEQLAQSIRLHGSLAALDSREMIERISIERISMITGVALDAHEGVLIVGSKLNGGAP
jgi:ferric-dicitrate binding protein FerR (iron transport regulator)